MEQKIFTSDNGYKELDAWIYETGVKKLMVVCDDSIKFQKELGTYIERLNYVTGVEVTYFNRFQPNPLYESVVDGVQLFREKECTGIIAVGGGSAMDVAKCIKLYSNMDGDGSDGSFLKQKYVKNDIPFLAIPTTAGTGSEATKYAVIYYEGKKQSVTCEGFIPDAVLMDPDCLATLPAYQKKATMMDALCHAIESFWSVNSTDESKEYSKEAIRLILSNMEGYMDGTASWQCRRNMLLAANIAGKAINITQTTAGHAMCYKITSMFGVAHGHAAVLCNRVLFPWMVVNTDKCIDERGQEYIKRTLDEIGQAMGCKNAESGAVRLIEVFDKLELSVPKATREQLRELSLSVNPDRLKNHPIMLDEVTIEGLYKDILISK